MRRVRQKIQLHHNIESNYNVQGLSKLALLLHLLSGLVWQLIVVVLLFHFRQRLKITSRKKVMRHDYDLSVCRLSLAQRHMN